MLFRKRISAVILSVLFLLPLILTAPDYSDVSAADLTNLPTVIKGDINSDGVLNALDMIAFKNCLIGKSILSDTLLDVLDLYSDNTVDIVDLLTLKSIISGTASQTKIFYVKGFGAKGDGVTDDGMAVANCVKSAVNDTTSQKEIRFQKNTTYRLASAPATNSFLRVMDFTGGKNIKVIGSNTKLLMKAPYRVAYIYKTANIDFSGFVIDYFPKPFTAAKVLSIAGDRTYIDFTTDADLGFEGTLTTGSSYFAFRNRVNERLHYFISKMQKLGDEKFRLYMTDKSRVGMATVGESFILPIYGSSHSIGSLFSIQFNSNFSMSDVTINAQPDFGFDIRSNTGVTKFTNVNYKPSQDSGVYLTSWRDGFHMKDNLSKIIFDNCYIGPLGDDAFNIASVICNVNSFNLDAKTISMTPTEAGSTRDGLAVGDELVAYNMQTGAFIGEAKVTEVLPANGNINVRVNKSLSGLTVGCQVAFYRWNKDYVVKNSYIEGTVRVRSSGTFENCQFNVFWVRVENEGYVEGPVPKDVLFKNCTFTTSYVTNPEIFHVGTLMKSGVSGTPQYKCKNIVLENCTFTKGTYSADTGNELIIR